jgi:hypothetical protein
MKANPHENWRNEETVNRRNCTAPVVLISLFLLLPAIRIYAANWVPEVSLDPFGAGYFGKYSGNSGRYNLDGGVSIGFDLLSWDKTTFYLEYITLLEMAEQVGNISLDPRYSHTFIIEGLRIERWGVLINPHLIHDCKHVIDMPPDSNKVVFNRLKLAFSRNLNGFKERFQTENETRSRRVRWEAIYGFYPQSKVIDYLNSRPYYHHEIQVRFEYPLLFYRRGELFMGARARYVMSAHDPPKYYRDVTLLLEAVLFQKKGVVSLYLEYYALAEDPLKAPEGLSLLGLRYAF